MDATAGISGSRCLSARRSVSAALDQEAADRELDDAALHLARCLGCRRFFVEIDAVASALRATALVPRRGRGRC
jgi:hypothetical protein